MATWIAHLRIAESLLDRIPLDAGQFAIGSIAPDSGIPDENWEKFDPPPEVTHFKRSASVHKDIADLDFYRGYLAGFPPSDAGRYAFRLGYFFHLVTDNLWTIKVGLPTSERWAAEFEADKKFIWTVKRDWYGLDFLYLRDHPESLFQRVFLDAKPDTAGLDFLPPEALSRQLAYIKEFYQRTDERVQEAYRREYIYLSQAEMDAFVDETAEYLVRAYAALAGQVFIPDSVQTILDILRG
ncbi:MAG: hypothetical protein AB1846_01145 [Chloroflexota bacterium]